MSDPTIPSQDGRKGIGVPRKRRNLSLANISIPSALTIFDTLKRKPLPINFTNATHQRSLSLDSPKRVEVSSVQTLSSPFKGLGPNASAVRNLDINPHGSSPSTLAPTSTSIYPRPGESSTKQPTSTREETLRPPPKLPIHCNTNAAVVERLSWKNDRQSRRHSAKLSLSDRFFADDNSRRVQNHQGSPTMTTFAERNSGLYFRVDSTDGSSKMPTTQRSPQKSPPRKMGNLFGWKTRSPNPESPSTNFSELSSMPSSPMIVQEPSLEYFGASKVHAPAALDTSRANSTAPFNQHISVTPLTSPTPPSSHMADLEQELREISFELANSIKREMELEDEVERMRSESQAPSPEVNRRTSDYYSDSGAGSIRHPFGDHDATIEQLEKVRRTAGQEKAQMKLDMSQRLQDAFLQRREAEEHAQRLLQHLQSQIQVQAAADRGRVHELETKLSDLQRKLSQERQVGETFQDLLEGMRQEIEQYRLERDNLRDEVVPQLRAKIGGLETNASQTQTMTYEHTRMQQELQAVRIENQALLGTQRLPLETQQQQQQRFNVITEEGASLASPPPSLGGLSRSKSFINRSGRASRSNSVSGDRSLGRAESVKEKTNESRETLAQKVKDVESQRDALHKALKSLLDRHLHNEKQQAAKLRQLEMERDKFMSLTPRRTAFHTEVRHLKEEVQTLRRRGDDALEQKWRCEKGLGGLKMDLDRAQQETTSLRDLLSERNFLSPNRLDSRGLLYDAATVPDSLDKAYSELRDTQALSIARIKDLDSGRSPLSTEASRRLELLKQSMSDTEPERDRTGSRAESHNLQSQTLQKSDMEHLSNEQSMADELYASATRMEQLADQVQIQLLSNSQLRRRLAEAIERGERDQRSSKMQISQMQRRLRELEEKLEIAQKHSEETVNAHEAEVQRLEEAHNTQLQRATAGLLSPNAALFAVKSPKLDKTSSGAGISIAEATKTAALERRVQELETALTDADKEMGEVVSRMNHAQMEVADLQAERDDAMMKTRKLQAEVVQEREKAQLIMSMAA